MFLRVCMLIGVYVVRYDDTHLGDVDEGGIELKGEKGIGKL